MFSRLLNNSSKLVSASKPLSEVPVDSVASLNLDQMVAPDSIRLENWTYTVHLDCSLQDR